MRKRLLYALLSARTIGLKLGLAGTALAGVLAGGNGGVKQAEAAPPSEAPPSTNALLASCGYQVTTGTYSKWPGGYQAWVKLANVSGPVGTDFKVLVDLGGTTVVNGYLANFAPAEGGASVTAPSWLQYQKIPQGKSYEFQWIGGGNYTTVTPWIISINGTICDQVAPVVAVTPNEDFFTSNATLTLTAAATDNVAVRKVVFEQDGVVIGTDTTAPFTFNVAVSDALNGRHLYTATAYDPTGNHTTSLPARVLVAIGNKFLGTATSGAGDYAYALPHFDQITPENGGKWGVAEPTRDVMSWDDLDQARDFADDSGLRFKMHTLIWGLQQPGWLAGLSQADQLAEIEEWFAAVAARYPDLEMIDVVNEPLHAVPSYAAALGGAGTTGWDWVIKSFELARKHFPKSQLILNDYNILVMDQFTTDYLAIIQLLQERGLIDGIGEQAHFLERADIDVVAGNLDRLAATGLPIYISELDVNFADDARQANVMKDLFPLFWNHPSVVGVTHWGHQEGSTFQPNAFLIHGDGSTRPALDFMECTALGNPDCPVPEYIPGPRVGEPSGIVLEAEDYDAAEGLIALGGVVAFTDDGDWQNFLKVDFQDNWDTFSLTYARGSTQPASITVHLDSLESAPVLEVELPPTDGWGSLETLSVPFSPLAERHDVYVQYHGGFGVANVDSFEFHAPEGSGPSVLANGYFETNANGWFSWDGVVTTTDTRAVSGEQSLRVSNRAGNGPAATNLTSAVTPGTTYEVSLWTTISGAAQADVNVTRKIQCAGEEPQYGWLVNPTAVSDGEWVELTGDLVVPNCTLAEVTIYAEGPPGGVDLYLDHASVRGPGVMNLVSNSTFETAGTSGWFSWDGSLSATTARAHTGSKSLLVSNRAGNGPAATSLTSAVAAGKSYDVSFWVTIGGAAQADVNLAQAVECDGVPQFAWIANPTAVTDGIWTELTGKLVVPACNVTNVLVYAEGPPGGIDLYVDDVSVLAPLAANLLPDGAFETATGTGSWFSWDGTLSTNTTLFHGGAQSLRVSSRSGNGPAARNVTSLVTPGKSHQVTFWASITGATSANVNTTSKVRCQGGTDQYNWIAAPQAVAANTWVELSAPLAIPDCTIEEVLIFAEGPPGGVDLYVDDVVLAP